MFPKGIPFPNASFFLLSVLVPTFFLFGLFHLGTFETTDEHLWKYDRIPEYWEALFERDWAGTYINDKPGITVALISGIGLLSEPDPAASQLRTLDTVPEHLQPLFERYDATRTESVNFVFRLPILIFASLSIIVFFFLVRAATGSFFMSAFTIAFLSLNPILIGMSQIINPDSFFWIWGGLATMSYLALLETGKRRFLLFSAIAMGFALLSKYTAFALFLFFVLALIGKLLFPGETPLSRKTFAIRLLEIPIIFVSALAIFSIFLPAVFTDPNLLFKGIGQFFRDPREIALVLTFVAIIGGGAFFARKFLFLAGEAVFSRRRLLLSLVTIGFSLLFLVSFANILTDRSLSPVEALRDASYANEPNNFAFKPVLDRKNVSIFESQSKLFLMEAYPLVFSLSPFLILIFFLISVKILRSGISDTAARILFPVFLFTLLYLASTLSAKIVTNARYLIILYPLLSLAAGVAAFELLRETKRRHLLAVVLAMIIVSGITTLFHIKPFFFSYTNSLLPKEMTIHDSWGHGSYEAARYLNGLPDAESLVIWSNSDTVCRFFDGLCLKSRKIDLSVVTPDYFVVSKRGSIKERNRFVLLNNKNPEYDSDFYFSQSEERSVWELLIGDRPGNFIRIIPFEP